MSKVNKLVSLTLDINELTSEQIKQMYQVFEKYYNKVNIKTFKSDLESKNKIILLLDKSTNQIQGFSTISDMEFTIKNRTVKGIFSGDTIIAKEYWGQSALQIAFIKYLFLKKLRNPFSKVYWFLISKGFKTYLLLANNFTHHYPRHEQETPVEIQSIMDSFASELYPQNYNPKNGVIEFDGIHDHLNSGVAPITNKMMKNSRIAFFTNQNPGWEKGSELVCLAEFDLGLPFRYPTKFVFNLLKRRTKKLRAQFISVQRQIRKSYGN